MPDQANLTKVSQNDGICNIVLHDSRKRNSLSAGMLDELKRNLYEASEDKNTKVIILSANGPVFSAGHNLKELDVEVPVIAQVRGPPQVRFRSAEADRGRYLPVYHPYPYVSDGGDFYAGLATAAGCQLVASCDLAVASENAKFATPGVSIGLFCSTPAVAIARALPRKVAMQMLLTAKPITAHDALNHGLVNKVVKDEDLEETTLEVARGIASFSRPVMALGKKCFYNQISKPRDEAYRIAESAMVHNLTFTDAQEGINAFLQKRKPNWTDS
eukprot:gene8385-14360_t